MAKYKVLQVFRDVNSNEVYKANQVIEMTVKRADEAIKNLKEWDGEFLERIDNKQDDIPPADPPANDGEGEQEGNQEDGE